jgi:hypothetical protein
MKLKRFLSWLQMIIINDHGPCMAIENKVKEKIVYQVDNGR